MQRELGLERALASRWLFTDSAEVLYNYAEHVGDNSARELVVVRNDQRVFTEIMQNYLRRVHFAHDGYAEVIALPQYRVAEVTIDARHAFARPRFARGGVKIEDVVDLFRAGEPVDVVAEEYGLTRDEIEDVLCVATRTAA